MNDAENGITMGEVFGLIFKRIWWVIAAVAVAAIAFACFVHFYYDPRHRSYSVQFELRLPDGGAYPDGTLLRISDSVSLPNLQTVKEEALLPEEERTGRFADVDIQSMVDGDGIRFTQESKALDDGSYSYLNSVTVSGRYFADEKTAAAFLKAVAEFPVRQALYIVENMHYGNRLSDYDAYSDYESKIGALRAQKEYILSVYGKIGGMYGGEYVPAGTSSAKSIDEHLLDLINVFSETEQEYLQKEIEEKDYYYEPDGMLRNLDIDIALARREIATNEALIEGQYKELSTVRDALSSDAVIDSFLAKIADYRLRNDLLKEDIAEWEREQESIRRYTEGDAVAEKAAFDARLNEIREELSEDTQVMRETYIATYREQSRAVYLNNKVAGEGGIGTVQAALLGALAGLLLSCAAILIKDLPALKRVKSAAASPAEETEEGSPTDSAA